MPTVTGHKILSRYANVTERKILDRYATDVAAVTEQQPATDLATFAEQLITAAQLLNDANIPGGDDADTAATLLAESIDASPEQRPGLVARAAGLLRVVGDAFTEYREDMA